jgi:ATP-dependent RNA helicase DDX49/DBP8
LQEESPRKRKRQPYESDEENVDSDSDMSSSEEQEQTTARQDAFPESSRFIFKPKHQVDSNARTGALSITSHSTFASLGVAPVLLSALSKMSIQVPTEVQVACIPPLLAGEFSNILGGDLQCQR